MQTFFNAVSDDDFSRMVDDVLNNIGWHVDVCHCEFPEGLEPGEEPFDGAKFANHDEEVLLSPQQFLFVLGKACDAQKRRRPDQAGLLDEALLRERRHRG